MNLPCSKSINCPGSDDPILNSSSEGVDRLLFAQTFYPPHPVPCLVNCDPTTLYSSRDCNGVVYSATSQLDADLLALAASVNCGHGGGGGGTGTCFNDEQTVSFTCPDGTVFSYTVPAGTVSAVNNGDEAACRDAANAQALAIAQQQIATMQQNCGGYIECVISSTSPLPNGEAGVPYSKTLVGTTTLGNNTWALASGTLPPGLSLTPSGVIQGTPTTPGTYNFTVQLQGV